MKFSTVVLSLAIGSTSAFAPASRSSVTNGMLFSTMDKVETAVSTSDVKDDSISEVEPIAISTPTGMAVEEAMTIPAPVVPSRSRIQPGRYNDKENSIAIPFLKRPTALDGTHAGDFGFDPLGFTEDYDLYTMQESEIRHGRLAMLAVIGWPMSELLGPKWMLASGGRAPSVLNGFSPVSFLATVAIFGALGFFEYKTSLRRVDDKKLGDIHKEDMADIWKWGVAGDYNFDPLNLYSSIGDDAESRKGLRDVEISHGRSAMLGITSFVAWEALTGHAIVENSMFFHPNAMLPALVAGYFAFGAFYEREDSDTFLRYKLSSEGEARLENLNLGKGEGGESIDVQEIADKVSKFATDASEFYEKAQNAYLENVVKSDSGKN